MEYNLLYFDEVEVDINDAKLWYKEQKEGLEVDFSLAIEKAIDLILQNPYAYSIRYKRIRIAHPKVFPYNIHFYVNELEKNVIITAIVHNKRHAGSVKKRKE